MKHLNKMRFEVRDACSTCGECNGRTCEPVRRSLRSYSGIRFTSDGFDCALPVSIDSHSHCSFACQYCFSDNLISHREGTNRGVGQQSLTTLERLFAGAPGKKNEQFRKALKYDRRNAGGYPCAVQLGALNDPSDNIERNQGWLLEFIKIAIKYGQPVRMSTKGRLLAEPEYLDALSQAPHLFWVAFSIITADDEVLRQVDRRAPDATQRLATMKALHDIGVKTSLRFRPMIPGISDRTRKMDKAYRVLIERAAEAGAGAISYEVAFSPGMPDASVKKRWETLSKVAGYDLLALYRRFGRVQACTRPPYQWTEEIMHAVRNR